MFSFGVMSDALGESRSSADVRYASDTGRIAAPPRSAALGHVQTSDQTKTPGLGPELCSHRAARQAAARVRGAGTSDKFIGDPTLHAEFAAPACNTHIKPEIYNF